MIELVNLEECVGYVVKVIRRDDTILYGKIEVRDIKTLCGKIEVRDDAYLPFIFNLGNGCGVCYHKNGRVLKKADELDIIWIKKIAKDE